MALMLSRLYDALRLANVPEDKAREAAEEVATYEQVKSDTHLLKGMVGVLIAIVLGVFWMQWQTITRMGDLQGALGKLESRLAGVGGRLGGIESRLAAPPGNPSPQ